MDTEDTTPSDEMVRLRAKVEHTRAKKKRYRKGLCVRKATEKADAAAAASPASWGLAISSSRQWMELVERAFINSLYLPFLNL